MLVKQVQMTTSASPGTTVWVYRNSIKALPWYTSVRVKLEDPAYSSWFVPFNCSASDPLSGCHVPICDTNYDPPLCSALYHDQTQSPGFPTGDGNCAPPACDTGSVPSGEYMFDPRAANVSINGQTLVRWFIDEYLFGPEGAGNANVSGFFFDDEFDANGPSEYEAHVNQDIGFDDAMLASTSAAYWAYMAQVYTEVLERHKFVWQQMWNGPTPTGVMSTCPAPLVNKGSCASDLRALCSADSPARSRVMMYAFTPGVCGGDPGNLTDPLQDIANFLLSRGNYAYLGHGWEGCSRVYEFPPELSADYGEPVDELCKETAPGSQVFVREWSKATIQMDCTSWTPTITLKDG